MEPCSLMTFIGRSMLGISQSLLSQVDPALRPKINSDAFLQAFSFEDQDGQAQNIGSWPLGPSWRPSNAVDNSQPTNPNLQLTSQHNVVADATAKWNSYFARYAGHIPYAVAKGMVPPLTDTPSSTNLHSVFHGLSEQPITTDPFKPRKTATGVKLANTGANSKRKRADKNSTNSMLAADVLIF